MSSSCRKLYVALGAGAVLGLTPGARADNWELLPRIEAGGSYNDNYRMANTSADELQVYGPYIDAQLNASLLSPRSKLEIVPRIHSNYFPTDHADQSTDGYLTVDGEYKTLRSDFTGIAQYANESVIYSELLPANFAGVALGQVVGGESGVVSFRDRDQLTRILPNFTYDFTQRTHLNLQAEYDRMTFSHSEIVQVPYDNYMGQAGILFDVTPRSTLQLSGIDSQFEPQLGGHSTNTYGAQLEWDLRRTQVMQFYARVGANRSEAETATLGTVAATGITGGMGVEWRFQITEVVLDALRALTPSDAGAEVVNNELRFRILRAFAPRFSGYLSGQAVQVRGASSRVALAVAGEDYFTTEAGVEYQITENYRIKATYDFMWQRFQGTPSAASSAVALAFIYQPLSRYEPLPELTGIPPQER